MRYGSSFTRISPRGELVGVVKYKDGDGRWRQRSRTFPGPRAEAEAAFGAWLASIGAAPGGRGRAGAGAVTVGELVASTLSGELARGLIERSTYEAQAGYARVHILPAMGGLPVRAVTPQLVEEWAEGLSGSLSSASARVAWCVLRKALARAARDGLVERNPLDRVRAPRARAPRPAYLERPMRRALEEAVSEEWGCSSAYGTAALVAMHAGLRCGEVCALRWRDVPAGEVRVRAAVGRCPGGGYLKAPKSAASARTVPASARLASVIGARRAEVARGRGRADPSWFVCGEAGAFCDPRALSRAFSRLCERHGIVDSLGERATFRTLRHTFATVAVAGGVDVKTVSSLLGHASAKVTLDVYASADEGARRAGVDLVAGLM